LEHPAPAKIVVIRLGSRWASWLIFAFRPVDTKESRVDFIVAATTRTP